MKAGEQHQGHQVTKYAGKQEGSQARKIVKRKALRKANRTVGTRLTSARQAGMAMSTSVKMADGKHSSEALIEHKTTSSQKI